MNTYALYTLFDKQTYYEEANLPIKAVNKFINRNYPELHVEKIKNTELKNTLSISPYSIRVTLVDEKAKMRKCNRHNYYILKLCESILPLDGDRLNKKQFKLYEMLANTK